MLIHHNLLKKDDLDNLKSKVGKLDVEELKNVPSDLTSFKIKIDKLDLSKI